MAVIISVAQIKPGVIFVFNALLSLSGAVHRVHRAAPRVQQVRLEALQDHPRGGRLVRPQQRAQGHDHVSQFLKQKCSRIPSEGYFYTEGIFQTKASLISEGQIA